MEAPHNPRFSESQRDRTVLHPSLPQSVPDSSVVSDFSFVVCADTQLGMNSGNREWQTELEYSKLAVQQINNLTTKPLFCCVCGDLVDMTANIFAGKEGWTEENCNKTQDQQNEDFKRVWDTIDPEIALVCVCGNHDVGNRPNRATVERFRSAFGDDYLAFWAKRAYNIVLNTSVFSDPTDLRDMYEEQLEWFEQRLFYANSHNASHVFVFGHHPWFLYGEEETEHDMDGFSVFKNMKIKDSYFHIPIEHRRKILELCKKYNVTASFSGHFHQNLVSKTSFGMDMIITGPLSVLIQSTAIPKDFDEPKTLGIRVVDVKDDGTFQHEFQSLLQHNK